MQISQQVRVRGSRWRIVDLRDYEDCRLVTLDGISPMPGRAQRQVLAPFDDIEPVALNPCPRFQRSGAWWRACRHVIAGASPPGALRTIQNAAIAVMPHQLEPALAVVRGLGSRVLLADEVGLGKTVQAGIVVSELRARGLADRVLVVAPAGLRDQWIEELSTRFGLDPHLADAAGLRRLSTTLPLGVNPWMTRPIAVASVDYLKRADVLPAVLACAWDVVIVDEAHGAAGESDRQAAVARLAARAAYVLLLTATPHSGDARAFRALCHFGTTGDDLLVFRRRRADVREGAVRRIHALQVRSHPAERRLHASLERYVALVLSEQGRVWLAASVLHKRALSSAWSLARSIERRLDALSIADDQSVHQLGLPLGDPDGESSAADDEPVWPAELALSDRARERRMLASLLAAARTAAAHESKLETLVRLLRRSREPAIVFTEYRDTLLHVRSVLARPAAVLHGGMTRVERAAAVADFAAGRQSVLLATDAGSEGLNLHHACRLVVNLELPWNPMRLEQRIGRVDRIGQHRTVHAFHLIAGGTAEQPLLARLKARVARARADIGVSDPIGAGARDEERAVARFVVLGRDEAPAPEADAGNLSQVTPDLREDAAREAARLTFARSLINRRASRAPSIARPWICRARRAALRAALGGRMLMVWRLLLEDRSGHVAESIQVPLIVEVGYVPRRWTARAVDDLRRRIEIDVFGADNEIANSTARGVVARWCEAAHRSAHAVLAARLVRERAIQAQTALGSVAPIQPGLFDRRAERAYVSAVAGRADEEAERRNRIARLERAAAIALQPPQLVLVLLP